MSSNSVILGLKSRDGGRRRSIPVFPSVALFLGLHFKLSELKSSYLTPDCLYLNQVWPGYLAFYKSEAPFPHWKETGIPIVSTLSPALLEAGESGQTASTLSKGPPS